MAITAARTVSYVYPEEEDSAGAFEWWLSPCGGSDLVPDEIKNIFDILNTAGDGVSSFRTPRNIRKGSGKKGDAANPLDRTTPRAVPRNGGRVGKKKNCKIPQGKDVMRVNGNTLRKRSCVNSQTHTKELISHRSLMQIILSILSQAPIAKCIGRKHVFTTAQPSGSIRNGHK